MVEYYDHSWNRLILFGCILVTIVGVVLPFIISRALNRSLKLREEAYKKELKAEYEKRTNDLKIELEKYLGVQMAPKLAILESEGKKAIKSYRGGAFLVQGYYHLEAEQFLPAIACFIEAGKSYVESEDVIQLIRINDVLKENLKHLKKKDLHRMGRLGHSWLEYVELLREFNQKGLYSRLIGDLLLLYNSINDED
jgi:hypothetical protein